MDTIRTDAGRRIHLMYRPSRISPGRGIANCGMTGWITRVPEDRVVKSSICLKCKRGPTPFVVKTDPRSQKNQGG